MKSNLSKKLFSITLGVLLALMLSILIFQIFFFESFYQKKKQLNLAKEINHFKSLYSYKTGDIASGMKTFEDETGSKIGIFSLDGTLQFIRDRSDNNSDNILTLQTFCKDLLKDEKLIYEVLHTGKTKTTTFYTNNSDVQKIGVVSSMTLNSKNDSLVIAVSSIQSIEEASDVISEFYIYIFTGMIFISVFLSFIYSNMISKPLIRINNVAKKMSKMNFNEKCLVDREDEIGNLANTLNFLSSNLDGALQDLTEKNKKLEEDIEKERNLETMRKDFVASVSHELKTPIGIIEGYAEGIKDGVVLGEDATHYLETIIDESKKMSILVSNMLELSKLESGVLKPKKEIFNINRLLRKLTSKHIHDFDEANIKLSFIEDTPYSYVEADIFQMEQVLTNLTTNALKYTPANSKVIIKISEEDELYKISIVNYDVQIADTEIDKLFNKFYRIDKSGIRNNNSTGLGLSIVKNILELHEFNYALSNIENGVEFYFTLPKINEDLIEE